MYKSMANVENVFIVFQKTFGEEGKEMSVHKLGQYYVKKTKNKGVSGWAQKHFQTSPSVNTGEGDIYKGHIKVE